MSHQPSRTTQFLCALCLAVLTSSGFAQDSPHGWDRFQFTGNETFSGEQLRDALIAEPDFLLATHPHSDRADVAAVTRRLLLAGYRNSGFKSPTIEVKSLKTGGATIRIDEGPRFRCGAVTIIGANRVDVQQLTERLTKPFAKEKTFPTFVEANGKTITRWIDDEGDLAKQEKPIWATGTPAKFDQEAKLSKSAKTALNDLGYSAALVQVSVATNGTDSTAELVVDILQEGDQDCADVFRIVGSDVNSPNDVRAFLELKPGLAIDQRQLLRLTKKLWDCGRFTKHNLHFDRDESGSGRLNIELADVPGMSGLNVPLSEAANILLKARTWLSDINNRGEDLSITLVRDDGQFQIVQSQHGMLIQMVILQNPSNAGGTAHPLRSSVLIDKSNVLLSQSGVPQVWLADMRSFRGLIQLETKFSPADSDEKFLKVEFFITWTIDRPDGELLLSKLLNLTPADFTGFAYNGIGDVEIADEKLCITGGGHVLTIDVATGQILNWESDGAELRTQSGLFNNLRERIVKDCIGKPNLYEATHPVTSLVKFLISEPVWNRANEFRELEYPDSQEFDPNLRSACDKLVSGGLLLPLDAFANHLGKSQSGERFSIPDESAPQTDYKRWALALVGKYTLKCAPQLFAEGTWPMTVAREACLLMVDRGKHTGKVVQELQSDESNGPLCDASVAYLLSLIHRPAASTFATRSLEKMEPAKFDQDVNVLLSGPCGQWIAGVLGAVTSLTPAEADALGELASSDQLPIAMKAVQSQATMATENESIWYQATHASLEGMLQESTRR